MFTRRLVGKGAVSTRRSDQAVGSEQFGKVRAKIVSDGSSCEDFDEYSRGRQRARNLPYS